MVASKVTSFKTKGGKTVVVTLQDLGLDASKVRLNERRELTMNLRRDIADSDELKNKFAKKSLERQSEKESTKQPSSVSSSELLAKIKQERAKSRNVRFTPSEKELMSKQFQEGLGQKLVSKIKKEQESIAKERDAARKKGNATLAKLGLSYEGKMADELWNARGNFIETSRLRSKTRLATISDLEKQGFIEKSSWRGYAFTEKGKSAKQALIDVDGSGFDKRINAIKAELRAKGRVEVVHPTYGTKYNVTYDGLQKILGASNSSVQLSYSKPRVSTASKKTADIAGLQKLKDDPNLLQMTLF